MLNRDHELDRASKLLAIILTIVILTSGGPFFLIGQGGIGPIFILFISLIYLFIYFINLKNLRNPITKIDKTRFLVSLLLTIYMITPFRAYDHFIAYSIWFLLFLTILFLNDNILIHVVKYVFKSIFVICLLALFVLFLKLIGLDLPFYTFNTGYVGIKSIFYVYPGTAFLYGQEYYIFGRELFRVSGIYAEPGHFGVICAMTLYLNPRLFKKWHRIVILIAGLLTLSLGFYVLLVGLILFHLKLNKKTVLIYIGALFLLILVIKVIPQDILERFILSKVDSDKGSSILDARTTYNFTNFYNSYYMNHSNLFGGGVDVLGVLNSSNSASDYRAFLIKYGIVGFFIYLFWFFVVNLKRFNKRSVWLAFFLFIVIFIHRSWLVGYLIFLFSVFIIPFSYEFKNLDNNKASNGL